MYAHDGLGTIFFAKRLVLLPTLHYHAAHLRKVVYVFFRARKFVYVISLKILSIHLFQSGLSVCPCFFLPCITQPITYMDGTL
jgi:hypothetical protein